MRIYFSLVVTALMTVLAPCLTAQEVNLYAYGHSLVDHRPPRIPTPSDQTTIIHWIHDIAVSADRSFSATGQYGFLPSHSSAPPRSQWGYQDVVRSWDEEVESYAEADINSVLMTAANFIQYVSPTSPHPIDASTTVVEASSTIVDWTESQRPDTRYYIYAHWPEMDLRSEYPPTVPDADEIAAYHSATQGEYSQWWLDYHDAMLASRPEQQIKLIPAGAIMSEMITEVLGDAVPFEELYEDSAPHGRASLYFLSGMITYMCLFEERVPENYMPDETVHPYIRQEITALSDLAWDRLFSYVDDEGRSRVFSSTTTSTSHTLSLPEIRIMSLGDGIYRLASDHPIIRWTITGVNGTTILSSDTMTDLHTMDLSGATAGLYLVSIEDQLGNRWVHKILR